MIFEERSERKNAHSSGQCSTGYDNRASGAFEELLKEILDLLAQFWLHLLLSLVVGVVPLLDSAVGRLDVIANLSVQGHQVCKTACSVRIEVIWPLVNRLLIGTIGSFLHQVSNLHEFIIGELTWGSHRSELLWGQIGQLIHSVLLRHSRVSIATGTAESVVKVFHPVETFLEILLNVLSGAAITLLHVEHVRLTVLDDFIPHLCSICRSCRIGRVLGRSKDCHINDTNRIQLHYFDDTYQKNVFKIIIMKINYKL